MLPVVYVHTAILPCLRPAPSPGEPCVASARLPGCTAPGRSAYPSSARGAMDVFADIVGPAFTTELLALSAATASRTRLRSPVATRGAGGAHRVFRPAPRTGGTGLPDARLQTAAVAPPAGSAGADWAPLRADGAALLGFRRGALPDLSEATARADAGEELVIGTYPAGSRSTKAHQWRMVCRACRYFGLAPLPPTVPAILAVGAALKAGRYRAASAYLSCYRVTSERAGFELSAPMRRAFTDAARSCARGLGGPTRALALPLARLAELPAGRVAWTTSGPLSPRNLLVVGLWWFLRELEVSSTRACHRASTAGRAVFWSPGCRGPCPSRTRGTMGHAWPRVHMRRRRTVSRLPRPRAGGPGGLS